MRAWRTCSLWACLALVLAACQAGTAGYQSLDEIAAALSEAGIECHTEAVEQVSGTLGMIECELPEDSYPDQSDSLQVILFDSEQSRVGYLFELLVWCGAVPEPPPTVAYVYGARWTILSSGCEVPADVMSEIGDAIGGATNVFDPIAYERFDFERPLEDLTTNDLKSFLGEPITEPSESGSVTDGNEPSALEAVPGVTSSNNPEIGTEARALGWEVAGWPEIYEANDVVATEAGFVAAGSTGFRAGAWISSGGSDWEPLHYGQDAIGSGRIVAISDSPMGLIAVGENGDFEPTSWLSPDGTNWERFDKPFGETLPADVTAGGQGALVVGQSSDGRIDIFTSPDFRSWDVQQLRLDRRLDVEGKLASAGGSGPLVTVATDPYRFFRGVLEEPTNDYLGLVWSSPDGTSWERVEGLADLEATAVAWGPDRFMLIGEKDGSVVSFLSSDGITWEPAGLVASEPSSAPSMPAVLINAITWTGTEWIAGGSRMGNEWLAYRSVDGVAWTEVELPALTGGIASLASGSSGVVAVGDTEGTEERESGGDSADLVLHTAGGSSWNITAGGGGPVADAPGFVAITATDQALYAVGAAVFFGEMDGIWRSTDGRTWEEIEDRGTLHDIGLNQLVWWNDRFYGKANRQIWTSPDGVDWTTTSDPAGTFVDAQVHRLLGTSVGLIAVGQVGEAGAIWMSNDGESWRRVPADPLFFPVPVMAIGEGLQGQLLAVGQYGEAVWSSHDGETWTRNDPDQPLFPGHWDSPGIAATESGWILVGAVTDETNFTESPAAWRSADGIAWEQAVVESASEGGAMSGVAQYAEGLVAVGTTGLWHSEEGLVWRPLPVPPVGEGVWGFDLVSWNDRIIAVGVHSGPIVWLGPAS